MARVSSSQAGPADLPQLVERLHAGGTTAVADLLQEELETIIDDLPLALEAESIRDHLPAILGRIESRLDRTFRRVIEIARQDDERSGLLLQSLVMLPWRGTASEDEFAWLVQQMSRNADPVSRLAAFRRCATLELHTAQVAILDALGSIHPDDAIRAADAERRRAAAMPGAVKPPETTGDLVRAHEAERQAEPAPGPATEAPETPAESWDDASAQMSEELAAEDAAANAVTPPPPADPVAEEPAPVASVEDEAPVYDESASPQETWDHKEAPPPDKLTVRTLLRSLEAPPVANLAAAARAPETNGNGAGVHPDDEPTVADEEPLEPTPHVENSLTGETNTAVAETANDESSSPEAAAAAAEPEAKKADPITVRTLLASLDSVMLSNAPGEEPAPAEPDPIVDESAGDWKPAAEPDPDQQRVTVMTMLRSLETVRVKMAALEDTPAVEAPVEGANGEVASVTDARPAEPAPATPKAEAKPWSDVDLKPLSPPDRARRLAKVRRALETPELKRGYLGWLFDREKDTFSVVSVRKEILEFAFERPVFLGFDDATRARLARWIRERTAADQIAPAAVLAALRRSTWTEGEPPQVDDKTRPIVDAATGTLSRVPSEERTALYNRDFTAWLFSIREWEDREVLDRYALDPSPGVAEGLFRALAAMDGLAARFGGTGGESALQTALGIWDRADNDGRAELAKAISAGWSRGLVLDRRAFFNEFWSRHQKHEAQRPSILVALSSFEKEIEAARAKDSAAAAPPTPEPAKPAPVVADAPPKKVETPRGGTPKPAFAEPPKDPPATAKTAGSTEIAPREPARPPVVAKEVTKPPIAPRVDQTRPSMRMPEDTPPPETPRPAASPFAEPPKDSDATAPQEEGTDRFFRMMRKNMEAGMRAGATPVPAPVAEEDDADDVVPEEGDVVDSDTIPDEGDAVLADSSAPKPNPLAAQRATLPPSQSPAAAPAAQKSSVDSRDEEIVLPNEPLRSLAEYTRFLKALSAGRPIDELLSAHAMDYKQYAGCMTAWGRLLQNRPDLALRMGQLLRATG